MGVERAIVGKILGPLGEASAEQRAARPPRTLQSAQVAFAGHNRSEDLGDPDEVAAGLRAACAMITEAGAGGARLMTGLAPGADCLAARCWRDAGMGPVHAVFPHLDDEPGDCGEGLMQSATWLDGRSTGANGRSPHLAQTRWLVGAADLLIVVWTGEHPRGAGGTADAVRLALEHGVPVLWVRPGEATAIRLIRPEYLDEDFGFLEFLEQLRAAREPLVSAASAEGLHRVLLDLGLAELPEPEATNPPPDSLAWLWGTYAAFRRTLGGRQEPREAIPPPPDLQAQPGFARLTAAHMAADLQASRLGAIHRSQQLLLLGAAILTAMLAAASAAWPQIKLGAVLAELALALAALLVWRVSERGRRHERWAEARGLAEDLRMERVAWALGVSTTPHGLTAAEPRPARNVRRAAGLPHGGYLPERVRGWGAWAMDELVAGQAAYHRGQSAINGHIGHRVHQLENGSFGLLIAVLVCYLALASGMALQDKEAPHWVADLVVMVGSIVPAIGAASLALEATLSLGEQAQRSRVLAGDRLQPSGQAGPEAGLEALQGAVKAAIRLTRAQEVHWGDGAVRRRLFRGG